MLNSYNFGPISTDITSISFQPTDEETPSKNLETIKSTNNKSYYPKKPKSTWQGALGALGGAIIGAVGGAAVGFLVLGPVGALVGIGIGAGMSAFAGGAAGEKIAKNKANNQNDCGDNTSITSFKPLENNDFPSSSYRLNQTPLPPQPSLSVKTSPNIFSDTDSTSTDSARWRDSDFSSCSSASQSSGIFINPAFEGENAPSMIYFQRSISEQSSEGTSSHDAGICAFAGGAAGEKIAQNKNNIEVSRRKCSKEEKSTLPKRFIERLSSEKSSDSIGIYEDVTDSGHSSDTGSDKSNKNSVSSKYSGVKNFFGLRRRPTSGEILKKSLKESKKTLENSYRDTLKKIEEQNKQFRADLLKRTEKSAEDFKRLCS